MSILIQKDYGGRVHGLTGDGIVALFGEYELKPSKTAVNAINAAKEMCKLFEKMKVEFFSKPQLQKFYREENELLDMRLGIGISFGPVVFDYFGAPGSRSYGPMGDHVNFAQRLEAEASRFDAKLVDRPDGLRAPILISRPTWVAAGQLSECKPLTLTLKGKAHEYKCYECWPETDVNQEKKIKEVCL